MSPLRVAALATNIPGPLAAAHFAGRGDAVTKIEPPAGDPLAAAAPAWYERICQGMEVRRLDLRGAAARDALSGVLAGADLLITTLRPAALERLDLGPARLRERYPRLCHVAIVGEAGERAGASGHDLTYQARSGLLNPPQMPRTVYADMFAAEGAVAAAYALLYERETGGSVGRHEIAIAQGAAILADALRFGLTAPDGPLGGSLPVYGLYRARDGWIALAALEEHFQMNLKTASGLAVLDRASLEAYFASGTCAQWEALAREHDVPLAALA